MIVVVSVVLPGLKRGYPGANPVVTANSNSITAITREAGWREAAGWHSPEAIAVPHARAQRTANAQRRVAITAVCDHLLGRRGRGRGRRRRRGRQQGNGTVEGQNVAQKCSWAAHRIVLGFTQSMPTEAMPVTVRFRQPDGSLQIIDVELTDTIAAVAARLGVRAEPPSITVLPRSIGALPVSLSQAAALEFQGRRLGYEETIGEAIILHSSGAGGRDSTFWHLLCVCACLWGVALLGYPIHRNVTVYAAVRIIPREAPLMPHTMHQISVSMRR